MIDFVKFYKPIVICSLLISSCSTTNQLVTVECSEGRCEFEGRENQNERLDKEGEKLELPNDNSAIEISNDFPIPEESQALIRTGEVPRPKKIFSSQGSETVEIRRLGEIYWVYAESLPSKTWPLIKDFLANGFSLVEESPSEGMISSQNLSSGENFYIRLEHGIKNNSSEVYLIDQNNNSLDISFFESLAGYISENLPGYEGNSIAAQSLNLNKKARIVYVRKEIGIEFRLGYERAWSAISRAVEKSDFRVIDRNRELRYIQLSLNNPTTTRFFNFFGSPEENNADVDYELTFTTVGENTLLEFKKVSDTAVSVNEIVDEINENLS